MRNQRGAALIEFAMVGPIVLALGLYGVELGNQALVTLRVNQIATSVADNASRMGELSPTNMEQVREADMLDVLHAARLQGAGIKLGTYGRITVSSLENIQQRYDSAPVQRIHWQRCMGQQQSGYYGSSYGRTATYAGMSDRPNEAGTLAPIGMGDRGREINAPPGSGVIVVEINYQYQPLVPAWLAKPFRIHTVASMIVRNNRDFQQIYNPLWLVTPSYCHVYEA